jgi:hypothetical protein
MDIEGSEPMALQGMSGLMKQHKPKLAVCVYHTPAHIYELPQQILTINPDYRLSLRHYSHWYAETVCYGV